MLLLACLFISAVPITCNLYQTALAVIQNSTWVPTATWRCLQFIMENHLNQDTLYFYTEDVAPPVSLWPKASLFLSSNFQFQNHYETDVVFVIRNVSRGALRGVRGRTVVITEDLDSALSLWERYRILHVIIIVPYPVYCEVYSWFGARKELIAVRHINTWIGDQFQRWSNFFPLRKMFFINRTMKFISEYYPFFSYPDTFNGPEDKVLKVLAEQMSFRLERVPLPPNFTFYSDFQADGSLGGFLQYLDSRTVDFAYGCIFPSFTRSMHGMFLPSCGEDDVAWSLAAPEVVPPTSGIHSGFSALLWWLILFVLFIYSATLSLVSQNECSISLCILSAVRMNLAQAYKITSKKDICRILIMLFSLYSLHIIWFYQSTLLINLFKVKYKKEVTSIEEAVTAGLTVLTHEYLNHTLPIEPEGVWETIYKPGRIEYVDEHFNNSKIIENRTVIKLGCKTGDYLDYQLYKPELPMSSKIRFFKEPYARLRAVMYMPIGHPLFPAVHDEMLLLAQSGLFEFWISSEKRSERNILRTSSDARKPLHIVNVLSTFYVLIFLLIVSCFAFICELLYSWLENVFNCCQMLPFSRKFRFNDDKVFIKRKMLLRSRFGKNPVVRRLIGKSLSVAEVFTIRFEDDPNAKGHKY